MGLYISAFGAFEGAQMSEGYEIVFIFRSALDAIRRIGNLRNSVLINWAVKPEEDHFVGNPVP